MAGDEVIELTVNGSKRALELNPGTPLGYVLRNALGLTGTRLGCELEQCGSCKVLIDGQPTFSCTTPVGDVQGAEITTVEGLGADGELSALQNAFVVHRAAQCGYCTSGMLIAANALLAQNPNPTVELIRETLQPNLCRCGSHPNIVKAVLSVAEDGS